MSPDRAGTTDVKMEEDQIKKLIDAIRYATLAPSTHNSQPWKFSIQHDGIRLFPDLSRRLPVTDPFDRELYISLGCALENLVLSLDQLGYGPQISYFPRGEGEPCIHVGFQGGSRGRDPALFEAIPRRQTSRNKFEQRQIPERLLRELRALPLEPGVTIHLTTDRTQIEAVSDFVMEADRLQLSNESVRDELISWIRFNETDARHTGDGLSPEAMGNPSGPRWLGSFFMKHLDRGERQLDRDESFLKSSPAIVALCTNEENREAWVKLGRSFERIALMTTAHGIDHGHVNQPIEVPVLRYELRQRLGLDFAHPQLLIRIGYAERPKSFRRPVDDVLIETPDTLFARSAESA